MAEAATGGGTVEFIELTAHERTIEGELDACELVYLLGFQDHIYRGGATVALRGSVSVTALRNHPEKEPGIMLKVTAFDFVGSQPRLAPINYAFLSAGPNSFAKKESGTFRCDDGGFCAAYGFFKATGIAEGLIDGEIAITFNRSPGASDVKVPISLAQGKPEAHDRFVRCLLTLLPVIEQKLEAVR